jgi:hypothetical protein
VKRCDARLPPRVAARAGWVAVASTEAAAAATVAARSRRSIATTTTTGSATVATPIAALRSTSPLAATAEATTTTTAHATDVTGSSIATATATSATSTATTEAGALASNGLKEAWDFLVGLFQQVKEIAYDSAIAAVEESSGNTSVSSSSGTTDSMNVVVNVCGEVIVDDMSNVRYVQSYFMISQQAVERFEEYRGLLKAGKHWETYLEQLQR